MSPNTSAWFEYAALIKLSSPFLPTAAVGTRRVRPSDSFHSPESNQGQPSVRPETRNIVLSPILAPEPSITLLPPKAGHGHVDYLYPGTYKPYNCATSYWYAYNRYMLRMNQSPSLASVFQTCAAKWRLANSLPRYPR